MRFTFKKYERLTSKKQMDDLFSSGKSSFCYPIKFLVSDTISVPGEMTKVLFSVPKRNIKHANKRNLVKRRMREAYRLNKQILTRKDSIYVMAFIYTEKKPVDYPIIEKAIITLLRKI